MYVLRYVMGYGMKYALCSGTDMLANRHQLGLLVHVCLCSNILCALHTLSRIICQIDCAVSCLQGTC